MWEVKNESLVMVTLPVCPCDCVISVPTLSPLLAFVYFWASTPFQEKNKALKHLQHPCLHHSSDRHTHKADCFVRSRGTLFLLRTHARTHRHYSKANRKKKSGGTSDLTALPVTSHDITAIHSHKENAVCELTRVNTLHRQFRVDTEQICNVTFWDPSPT